MKNKNLTLIFNPLWPEHISKDVFLVPYYLGMRFNYNVSIVYSPSEKSKDLPESINGVRLQPLNLDVKGSRSSIIELVKTCFHIVRNAKSIDLLMFIRSCSPHYELLALLYKIFNPSGKVYVKLDINPDGIKAEENNNRFSLKYFVHQKIKRASLKLIDCFSCETSITYNQLKESQLPQFQFGSKLQIIPNGFDEELLHSLLLKERSFEEKENLIITVGRLGSPEKNTEMFLRSLEKVNLDNWSVIFVGNIDERIKKIIELFYNNNPDKVERVKFSGPIYDKEKLWEIYNRAKVFVLTSNWEGYPIVYPEAKRFKNYLISTDVAACKDIIEDGKYGVSIPINDHERLAEVLAEVISGVRNIDVYENYNVSELFWKTQIEKIKI